LGRASWQTLSIQTVTGGEVKERAWFSSINRGEDVWFVALLIGRSPMSLKSLPIPPIPEEIVRIAVLST
jgi:hypothetical protein